MKLEKEFKIGGQIVEYRQQFLEYTIYEKDISDDKVQLYFVDKAGNIAGFIIATSEGIAGEGAFTSVDTEFGLLK